MFTILFFVAGVISGYCLAVYLTEFAPVEFRDFDDPGPPWSV